MGSGSGGVECGGVEVREEDGEEGRRRVSERDVSRREAIDKWRWGGGGSSDRALEAGGAGPRSSNHTGGTAHFPVHTRRIIVLGEGDECSG